MTSVTTRETAARRGRLRLGGTGLQVLHSFSPPKISITGLVTRVAAC